MSANAHAQVNGDVIGDQDAFSELEDLFSEENERVKKSEASVLDQNLTGFASCFPDWDLHPLVD